MNTEEQSVLPAEAPSKRLQAVRGSLWTVLGYGASNLIRLASNLVLAHLLFPGAFGLMLLVNVFLQGLTMFSDIGIGPSIIHNRRGDEQRFLDTAWTIQVGRGFVLWLVAAATAPLTAWYFEEPALAAMIPVAAITALIEGFNSTKYFTANRHLRLGRNTLLDFVSQCSGTAVMVGWAWIQPSVWALVACGVVTSMARMLLSHVALPGPRNHLCLDKTAYRELMKFGKWIFISTLLTFGAGQVDRLMLAKLVPIDRLGLFGVAQSLVAFPALLAAILAATVAFPMLAARAREDPAGLGAPLLQGRSILLPVCMFVLVGMALLAPAFFRTLYDPRYADAGLMAALLTLPCWIAILTISADRALLALGDSRALAMSNVASLAGKVLGCMGGFRLGGVEGFIIGSAVGNLAAHLVVVFTLSRKGVSIWRQDLGLTLLGLACVGCGLGILQLGALEFGSAHRVPLEVAMTLIVLVPCGIWALRRLRKALSLR